MSAPPHMPSEDGVSRTGPDSPPEEANSPNNVVNIPNWSDLVYRISKGEQSAMEELYGIFSRGIRYYLCRHLGSQELDDRVHDTFLIVVQAIQNGSLREPERLMGFVRTIVRRQVAACIDQAVQNRRDFTDMELGGKVADLRQNPEQKAIQGEKAGLMLKVLRGISARDREILTRFYLYEQTQEQICTEMNLSDTQFRLLKSRAKARFGELGKRSLGRKISDLFLRAASGSQH